jgi:hypothetical protein
VGRPMSWAVTRKDYSPSRNLDETSLIRIDSEFQAIFVTAQERHAPHPDPLPEGEGANGRSATLNRGESQLLEHSSSLNIH